VDTQDSRFSRLYTDHSFGIDPTSSEFKKTSAMIEVVKHVSEQRQSKLVNHESAAVQGESHEGGSTNVQSLVNRLKRKFKDN
jgi:hypothetical protein